MPDTMKITTCARILEDLAEDFAAKSRWHETRRSEWSAGSEMWKISDQRAQAFAESESMIRAAIRGLGIGSPS